MRINYFIWASDISNSTGEGRLARNFIKDLNIKKNKKIIIKTFESIYKINTTEINKVKNLTNQTTDKSSVHKYFGPLVGIIFSWIYYFRGFKIIYVNYLPLWNPLPFMMLPPKSILGPITGSIFMGKNNFSLNIRNIIFPILYSISSIWIQIRYKKAIFSTNLLKSYFPNNKNYFFNYVITFLLSKKTNKKKKYDLIYYYREHENKNNGNILNLINQLRLDGIKICTIGHKINKKNIKNFGYVSNQKVIKILKSSKASFSSAENLFSIFNIESINYNLNVFFDLHLLKYNNPIYTSNLIPIDFNKRTNLKIIKKNLNSNNSYLSQKYQKRVILLKKEFNQFIMTYF